jgi:hypothetical protein
MSKNMSKNISKKSIAAIALAVAFCAGSLSTALAAKHARATKTAGKLVSKPTGACAQPSGRCVSDCDQFNWCIVNTCVNGQSTPVPFWRCFQPSGLCLAPHC